MCHMGKLHVRFDGVTRDTDYQEDYWLYLQLLILLAVNVKGCPDVLRDFQLLIFEGGPKFTGQYDSIDPKWWLFFHRPLLILLTDIGIDAAGICHVLRRGISSMSWTKWGVGGHNWLGSPGHLP